MRARQRLLGCAPVTRISNEEAQTLLAQGARYVDVRTPEEFDAGHVPGALNLPVRLNRDGAMVDNAHFIPIASAVLTVDEPLLVGCRSGARSAFAVQLLEAAGFRNLHDVAAGFSGSRDPFGRPLPGWSQEDRPIETGTPEKQSYAYLQAQLRS